MSPSSTAPAATKAPLLIVNADDYGLTTGVSRAILQAHNDGVVTSTSVLTLAPGFERTASWLLDAPELGVGAHLAAVGEDPPLLDSSEIPTLVDARGKLWLSWRQFLPRMAAGRIDPDDVRREFAAQLELLASLGIAVDHLDTHQNLHLWPAVRDIVLDLGEQHGIKAVRITRSVGSGPVARVVRQLSRSMERIARRRGWSFPQDSAGFDEAGALELGAMIAALDRFGDSGAPSAEIATHPGEAGDPDLLRYCWRDRGGYRWGDELAALCSRTMRVAVEEMGFRLGTFGDLSIAP